MRSRKCLLIAIFILGMLYGCSAKNDTGKPNTPAATAATIPAPALPSPTGATTPPTTEATIPTTTEATVPQSPSDPVQTIDYEAVLRNDAFPAVDSLSQQFNGAVTFQNISATADTLSFTLSAPYIAQDLIAWYEAQPTLTEEALENQIITLLSGEAYQTDFSLSYQIDEGGNVHIRYTDEYLAAIGCGIREFYVYLQDQILGGA